MIDTIANKLAATLSPDCLHVQTATHAESRSIDVVAVPIPFFDLWGNLIMDSALSDRLISLDHQRKIELTYRANDFYKFIMRTRRGVEYTVNVHIVPVDVRVTDSAEIAGGVS